MRRWLPACLLLLGWAGLAWAGSAQIEARSHPTGLRVFVDGHCKGLTPLRLTITVPDKSSRQVEVKITGTGLEDWSHPVTLKPGDHKAVAAYLKRTTTATPPPSAPAKPTVTYPGLKGKIICLDPGHPSETSGGTSGQHITEQRANWLVALKLASLLEAQGARVVLTKKSEGEKVANRHRAEIANAVQAQLLVRLHCDSAATRGFAVYYPDRQGRKYGVTGPSKDIISRSQAAAKRFYPAALAVLGKAVPGRGIHGDSGTYVGGQQGALTGSIFSKVPVLTAEMVVLSQSADEAFIRTESGQQKMAQALLAGIGAVLTK